jgi:hypothetical protein
MEEDYKKEFLDIFKKYVTRPSSDRLLNWLVNKTDFFTAPASTRYHGACKCGLVMHSLNVYHALKKLNDEEKLCSEETIALVALCHDFCKIDYYRVSTRNKKNEKTGQWETVPFYAVEDKLPYGHGEKSVFIIERFLHLTTEEAMAIRWHMGGFDVSARGGSYDISEAYRQYPLAVMTHVADLMSTYLTEKGTSSVNN